MYFTICQNKRDCLSSIYPSPTVPRVLTTSDNVFFNGVQSLSKNYLEVTKRHRRKWAIVERLGEEKLLEAIKEKLMKTLDETFKSLDEGFDCIERRLDRIDGE